MWTLHHFVWLPVVSDARGPSSKWFHQQVVGDAPGPISSLHIRNSSNEVDCALSLLQLAAQSEEQVTQATLSPSVGNGNEDVGLEVQECSRPSEPHLSFEEVKSFEDFCILLDRVDTGRELTTDVRVGYYKLCLYKKEFLHPEDVYNKLVVGLIRKTVEIGDEIKRCKLTTSKEEFENWNKNLKALETLGMKVRFLRDKLITLARLVLDSESAADVKQYTEATNECKQIEDELKKLAAKRNKLKESAKKIKEVSGALEQKVERYELRFKEVVNGPW
ncbi:hypothetical protein HanXRQr2_Chr04g0156081 [Helianthus annuus]|uniref:Uncharacterized protein n=1 Tax=Helianthus annuus TaxID=4232 RepID=A0A9K3NQH9_HELAN|nr:hypothetical protein HanXRQr2_Chr04g0156081 [Helianthus annuus]KAJ0580357.1 hypothetical protein HanHA300_Chr04g0128301 [Helianthus annuus]KAJ0587869.1 hypothetical protein HanIR_Chr04g0168131 [Helianthus annuus]KAJ0596305.1 hypothetical protein HanHA89_Chr04g0141261 [Helianthus annuus]KAJ0756963.1 hypothetical protein HanLR1_Chr04g0133101 [Helianthus annuus]